MPIHCSWNGNDAFSPLLATLAILRETHRGGLLNHGGFYQSPSLTVLLPVSIVVLEAPATEDQGGSTHGPTREGLERRPNVRLQAPEWA
jgi:hypothetical protein